LATVAAATVTLAACATPTAPPTAPPAAALEAAPAGEPPADLTVLASTTILADIAQNVAGERTTVSALLPVGADPHSFQPTPADLGKIARSTVLIVNGAGYEKWLQETLDNAGGQRAVIEGSAGLVPRHSQPGEPVQGGSDRANPDPHFYLDPSDVATYADNVAAGLSQADPGGAASYAGNAAAYKAQLVSLDQELRQLLAAVPAAKRLLVTDHDDLGYFADRYDFQIVGMVLPSFSSEAEPSAREMAELVKAIKAAGAEAIFTEAGANAKLAEQVATEAGAKVVSTLYTHSLSAPDGPAATYLDLMRHNARAVAQALGGH
jgi:ABC-type Zn uptake system ZnuABC Zn-binding protein ZnuA